MMSTTQTALTAKFCFKSIAEAQQAADYVNSMVVGAAAQSNEKSLTVSAKTLSSMNDVSELLLDWGGQLCDN